MLDRTDGFTIKAANALCVCGHVHNTVFVDGKVAIVRQCDTECGCESFTWFWRSPFLVNREAEIPKVVQFALPNLDVDKILERIKRQFPERRVHVYIEDLGPARTWVADELFRIDEKAQIELDRVPEGGEAE